MDQAQTETAATQKRLRYSFWTGALILRGSVTPRVIVDVFVFGTIAAVITVGSIFVRNQFGVKLSVPVGAFGAVLGLLLVLRTNAGYDRWWEARKLWGGIVNQSRNLAVAGLTYGPDDATWRKWFVRWAAAFPHVMRRSLREERMMPEVARLIGSVDVGRITKNEHMPSLVAHELAGMLREARDRGLDPLAFLQAEQQRSQLIDHLGGCERIRQTPLARSSAIQVRRFILLFLTTLPFALIDAFDYDLIEQTVWSMKLKASICLVPFFVMLMAYPLLSLDRIGMELQNPFDTRRVDHLPLDEICNTIEQNLLEMLKHDPVSSDEAATMESIDLSEDAAEFLSNTSSRNTYIS